MLVIAFLISSCLAVPRTRSPNYPGGHAACQPPRPAARDRADDGASQPTSPLPLAIYDETSPTTAARGCAAQMPEFSYTDPLPLGEDTTEYRRLAADGIGPRRAFGISGIRCWLESP